jgi:hypothetical protein
MDETKQPLSINSENNTTEKHFTSEVNLTPAPPQQSGYGRGLCYKFIILLCISFIAFGSYFAYDSVSALEEALSQVDNTIEADLFPFEMTYPLCRLFT